MFSTKFKVYLPYRLAAILLTAIFIVAPPFIGLETLLEEENKPDDYDAQFVHWLAAIAGVGATMGPIFMSMFIAPLLREVMLSAIGDDVADWKMLSSEHFTVQQSALSHRIGDIQYYNTWTESRYRVTIKYRTESMPPGEAIQTELVEKDSQVSFSHKSFQFLCWGRNC